MTELSKVNHLSKEDIIKNGSFFTPADIVNISYNQLKDLIDEDTIILDLCSGYGAFLDCFKDYNCIATEMDKTSCQILKQNFPNIPVYKENSLLKVGRKKYKLKVKDKLVIVGNPPYNDITSQYKKNNKGTIEADEDLKARDLGISFLKCYNKLKPDYISVLHPLSYLIKKTNFKELKEFSENYKLVDGVIFSSKEFESIKKTTAEFPVVCALYKRGDSMDFDYIKHFKFKIYKTDKEFVLNNFKTIDKIIPKYPTKNSSSSLQFYTLRDMNSLRRNKGFVSGPINNGIDITIENLYQYAWLQFLKDNFSDFGYLLGNLSPLYSEKIEQPEYRNVLVSYAYNMNNLVQKNLSQEEIENHYGKLTDNYSILFELLDEIKID